MDDDYDFEAQEEAARQREEKLRRRRHLMVVNGLEREDILRKRRPLPKRRLVQVPGTGITDLEHLIVAQLNALHPALRQRAHWVSDPSWLTYVRRIGINLQPATGLPAGVTRESDGSIRGIPVETILGLPVYPSEDGGWPHLEPPDRVVS